MQAAARCRQFFLWLWEAAQLDALIKEAQSEKTTAPAQARRKAARPAAPPRATKMGARPHLATVEEVEEVEEGDHRGEGRSPRGDAAPTFCAPDPPVTPSPPAAATAAVANPAALPPPAQIFVAGAVVAQPPASAHQLQQQLEPSESMESGRYISDEQSLLIGAAISKLPADRQSRALHVLQGALSRRCPGAARVAADDPDTVEVHFPFVDQETLQRLRRITHPNGYPPENSTTGNRKRKAGGGGGNWVMTG